MTARKEIARYGPKGRTVRVFVEAGGELVRIQWREAGALKTKSYPNTRNGATEAKAWAKGFADTRDAVGPAPRITNRELWTSYTGSVEFRALRTNSVRLYGEAWRRWELMWGASFIAEQTTPAMADTFVSALEKRGLEISTVGHTIRLVRRVFGWGEGRGLLNRNRLASWRYKVSKDRRRQHQERKPGEFRSDDWAKIVAQLSPLEATQWRAWVALTVCGTQGARQHAVLHLRWEDVDFSAGRITWRAAFDKMGREWAQPLRDETREALLVALGFGQTHGKGSPWVLPAGSSKNGKGETYSQQSLWLALTKAEARAGVTHRAYRGAHGARRLLARDVAEITGDPVAGLHAIGDTDIRMAANYLKKREDQIDSAIGALDRRHDRAPRTAPDGESDNRHGTAIDARTPSAGASHEAAQPTALHGDTNSAD